MTALAIFGGREKKAVKNLPNRAYYRSLIDYKQEACLLVDMEGDILLANPLFCQTTGFSEDDLAGLPLKAFAYKMRGNLNPLHNSVLREFKDDFFIVHAEGNLLPVNMDFKEIEGQKFLATIQLKNEISVATDNQPTATSIPIESHQLNREPDRIDDPEPSKPMLNEDAQLVFRTAVSGLEGLLQILRDEINPQQRQKHLESALRALERIKSSVVMAGDADVGKEQQLKLETVDLVKVVGQVVLRQGQLAREIGVEVTTDLPQTLFAVTDERILTDVFDWLIEKAIRFTRNDQVIFSARPEGANGIILVTVDNLGLELSPDIGRMMSETKTRPQTETLERIGKQDTRLRKIFQDSLKAGVEWDFEYNLPRGMIAKLRLQGSADAGKGKVIKDLEERLKALHLLVLVVEDDRLNAKVLEQYLKEATEVLIAYSGNEALNYMGYLSPGTKVDVVLMDINLPEPWNGVDLMDEIKRRYADHFNPIFIAQTANSSKSTIDNLLRRGFSDVLTKPVDKLHLLKTISQFLK